MHLGFFQFLYQKAQLITITWHTQKNTKQPKLIEEIICINIENNPPQQRRQKLDSPKVYRKCMGRDK